MKNNKTLLTLAAAGLIGAGLALPGSATAQTIRHRCDANGCEAVRCIDDSDCQPVDPRHYGAMTSYDGYRANGRYIGNTWVPYGQRRAWLCDAYGENCHWMYESF